MLNAGFHLNQIGTLDVATTEGMRDVAQRVDTAGGVGMVALAEGTFPIISDQPEDALHTPFIQGYIVETLRNRRFELRNQLTSA